MDWNFVKERTKVIQLANKNSTIIKNSSSISYQMEDDIHKKKKGIQQTKMKNDKNKNDHKDLLESTKETDER